MRRLLDLRSVLFMRKILSSRSFKTISASHLFIVLSFICFSASARSGFLKTVSGRILSSDGAALSAATVTVKGTNTSVITDNAGIFRIDISDAIVQPVLIVSSVGYLTKEIQVSGLSNIDMRLEVDVRKLDGIVVIGYGTQRRKDLTGSIASISGAQIDQRPVSTYEDP